MLTKSDKTLVNITQVKAQLQIATIRKKPEEFSVQLLQLIADDSPEAKEKLIKLAKKAEKDYDEPKEYKITGIVYSLKRQRNPQISKFISALESSKNGYERAKAFASIISEGELFEDSSYNYHLFVAVIEAVLKFRVNDHSYYPIETLKTILEGKLDEFIKDTNNASKSASNTKTELDNLSKAKIDNTKISNDFEKAQKIAKQQKGLTSFCLIYGKEGWYFSWVDNKGSEHQLNLSEKSKKLLPHGEGSDISKIIKENVGPLKIELCRIKEVYLKEVKLKEKEILDKIQIIIDPSLDITTESLKEKGIHSTFILDGTLDKLIWVNYLNKPKFIALEQYPLLQAWLANHKQIGEEALLELKRLLSIVDTSQKVDNSAKEALAHQFTKSFEKKPLEIEYKATKLDESVLNNLEACMANKLLLAKPFEKKPLEVEPKPLDLKLFSNLEECMANKLLINQPVEKKPLEVEPKKFDVRLFAKMNEHLKVKHQLPVELPKANKLDLDKNGKFKDLITKLTHQEQTPDEDDNMMQLFSSSI